MGEMVAVHRRESVSGTSYYVAHVTDGHIVATGFPSEQEALDWAKSRFVIAFPRSERVQNLISRQGGGEATTTEGDGK